VEALRVACGQTTAAVVTFSTPSANPVLPVKEVIMAKIEEKRSDLVKILTQPIPTIKRLIGGLKPGDLKILIDHEKANKKRKSLLDLMKVQLKIHETKVKENVGKEDTGNQINPKGYGITALDSSFTVIESDIIDSVLVPLDKE
jgi:hypothetical protein